MVELWKKLKVKVKDVMDLKPAKQIMILIEGLTKLHRIDAF